MKKSSILSETQKAERWVKGLALGVFFFAVLWLLRGLSFLVEESSEIVVLGIGFSVAGIVFLRLSYLLFTKQNYPIALVLTVLSGLHLAGIIPFTVIGVSAIGLDFQTLQTLIVSVVFFLLSYKGMKAAKFLKKTSSEKISPEIFS